MQYRPVNFSPMDSIPTSRKMIDMIDRRVSFEECMLELYQSINQVYMQLWYL